VLPPVAVMPALVKPVPPLATPPVPGVGITEVPPEVVAWPPVAAPPLAGFEPPAAGEPPLSTVQASAENASVAGKAANHQRVRKERARTTDTTIPVGFLIPCLALGIRESVISFPSLPELFGSGSQDSGTSASTNPHSVSLGPRMAKSVDDRGRGARMARRDEGAYCRYVTEEQRSQPGLKILHIM